MTKTIFIFIMMTIWLGMTSGRCISIETKVTEKTEILKAENKIFGGKSYNEVVYDNYRKKLFFPSESNKMCPKIKTEYIKPENDSSDEILLGMGGFGTVYVVNLPNGLRAVKSISFSNYLSHKLPYYIKTYSITNECIESLSQEFNAFYYDINLMSQHEELEMNLNLAYFGTMLENVRKMGFCSTFENLILETSLRNIADKYLTSIKNEAEMNFRLSSYSDENENQDHRTFPKFDLCLVDDYLNVYYVMEKMNHNFEELLNSCETSIGPQEISDRLIFYLQILYKANKLNEIGFTHCDIKPENAMFSSRKDYSVFSFVDYGFTTKESSCPGGTEKFAPLEFKFDDLYTNGSEFTKFGTRPAYQTDSFSVGLLLLAFETSADDYRKIMNTYDDILIKSKTPEEAFIQEKNFKMLLKEYMSDKTTKNLLSKRNADPNNEFAVQKNLSIIISNLVKFDFQERYPLSVAMYLVYQLYLEIISSNKIVKNLYGILNNDEKLMETLGIKQKKLDPGMSPVKGDHFNSLNDSEEYVQSVKEIEKLLEIRLHPEQSAAPIILI
jgi:serine/threonine protein kinase